MSEGQVELDRAEEQLEFMLYKEKKFVTALTLSRYADVKSNMATRVMSDFYSRVNEDQRKKQGLYGVYLLTGERKDRDETHRNACILVRETDLEKTKQSFSTIDECTLFSLQCQHIEELHKLFCGDIIDNPEYEDRDHERMGIVLEDPLAVIGSFKDMQKEEMKRMPNTFDVMKASAAGAKDIVAFKMKEDAKKKKKEEAEHERLETLFQKACNREKTPKNSPKKVPASPFSSGKKSEKEDDEASNSPILKRKRQRKIMLDNESGDEEEKRSASPKESAVKKRKEEEKKKEKKRAVIESDDDLFDKADDSPVKKDIKEEEEEEMEVDEMEEPKSKKRGKKEEKKEKTRTLEETGGVLRRSPRKQQPTSSGGPTKRFEQKDVNYVDEKTGMMCTRRDMVEVEVSEEELKKEKEREEARRPLETTNKKTNVPQPAAKTTAKGAAKKPVAGQSKISNFFTKK